SELVGPQFFSGGTDDGCGLRAMGAGHRCDACRSILGAARHGDKGCLERLIKVSARGVPGNTHLVVSRHDKIVAVQRRAGMALQAENVARRNAASVGDAAALLAFALQLLQADSGVLLALV